MCPVADRALNLVVGLGPRARECCRHGGLHGPDAGLETIERLNRITRLGQNVDATRALQPEAIDRTVAVLREYRDVIDSILDQTTRVRLTGTATRTGDLVVASEVR